MIERTKEDILKSIYQILRNWQLDKDITISEYLASVGAMEDVKITYTL